MSYSEDREPICTVAIRPDASLSRDSMLALSSGVNTGAVYRKTTRFTSAAAKRTKRLARMFAYIAFMPVRVSCVRMNDAG